MMSIEMQDEQWKAFLEGSMFEDHFDELGKICDEAYGGNSELFDNEFLRPMCLLLQELKTAAEKYFISIGKCDEAMWLPCYERFVTSVIHLSRLSVALHKGDFYLHLNFGSPGEIILKHYNSGDIVSRPLAKQEYEQLWSHKWTESLSQTFTERFLFMNCIVNNHNSRGLERRPWRYLMSIDSAKGKGENNQDINGDELSLQSTSSTFSLFYDLEKNAMSALDVNFEVLHSKVICMPGTRDKRGAPVIFVDSAMAEWELEDFNSEEIAKVCLYFYQIPREEVVELGFTFLIDARNSDDRKETLQIIGEALIFFEEMRPNSIHIAYILGRKDSYLMMFSANKLKEQLKFQFKLLSSINELVTFVDLDQLLINFGGDFGYDHDEWLQFRLKQEPFMAGCRSAIKLALAAMEDLHMGHSYNSVEECEFKLDEHQTLTTTVFSDSRLSALQLEGEHLVANLKQNNIKNNTPDWKDTMETVSKLYFKMNHVFSKLDVLCRKRKRELEDCLQLCCFHEEFSKTLSWLENDGRNYVDTPVQIAESYSHAITNHNNLETFLKLATTYIIQAYDLLEEGSDIAQSGCEQSIGIKEMCKVLKAKLDAFTDKLEKRRISLVSCVEFHQLLRQCSNWSIHALKFMALMNMEESNTAQGVASLKLNIEGFLQEFPMWNQEKLNEINNLTKMMNNEELQNESEKCLSEYKEVEDMFLRRQDTLQRAAIRVQVPGTCTNGVSEGSSSTSTSNSTSGIQEDVADLESDEEEVDKSDVSDNDSSLASPTRRRNEELETEEQQRLFYSLKTTEELDEETYLKLSPKVKEKLTYIVSEMVETERDYVKSLEYIIQNYVKEMDSEDLPASLRGRKNLVFGNIERLYDFHQRYFSQDLERHIERPFQIGGCFLKWERQFFLYALYNKNKPVSDELLRDHGSVYFRKRQEELNDKLDLCSYLIKPVQRIGKYALLLRDMIKVIETDSSCTSELRNAQEMVKSQLRHGNDLLAMDSIRDCDVNVKEQGRLLRQDDFMVWQSKKKHCRRVFLFEDLVLFSKTKKQASGADIFIYKSCLKTADIGLTETVGESGLRFELWFRRRRNVKKTVILQAKDMATKTSWVIEITRLLWRQAVRNREYGLAEATTGISVGSQPGEQVPTTRSPVFDESFQFSSTTSMSVMSSRHSYAAGGSYTSPLLNNRRYNRRLTTLKRNTKHQTLSPDPEDLSTPPAKEEQLSTPTPGNVGRPVANKSQSCPVESTEQSQEEGRFERRPSLKQRLFGGRGRSKNNDNEHVTHSNEHLNSKNNKSKKRTLKERFSSSRPMSVTEISSTHHHPDVESPHIHRSHSDASMVTTRKQPATSNTSKQEPIAEQPNASYHSVV